MLWGYGGTLMRSESWFTQACVLEVKVASPVWGPCVVSGLNVLFCNVLPT